MIRAYFHMFVFFGDASADVQLPCLGVEVDGGYADEEDYVNPGGGGAAGAGFGGYAADGGGAEEVVGCY